MIINIKWRDGHADSRGRILYHYQHCYYIDFGDCYCQVPWLDVEHTWVSADDFREMQKKAKDEGRFQWQEVL